MKKAITAATSIDVYVVLDVMEKIILVYLLVGFNMAVLPHLRAHWNLADAFVLVSECMAAFFILIRRFSRTASLRPTDWAVTGVGTFFPLLVVPSDVQPLLPLSVAVGLIASGFCLQILAKLTLRRSFGLVPANRGVKVGGPYRLLRHPMYAGYVMTHIAFLGLHPSRWNLAIYTCAFIAQCLRLLAEERVLSADPTYQAFMKTTRYRIIPFIF